MLYNFLQPHLPGPLPPAASKLLQAMQQVSGRAFVPAGTHTGTVGSSNVAGEAAEACGRATRGHKSYMAAVAAGLPPAEAWQSREEAFLRTGTWGGPPTSTSWTATKYGGSHVQRPLPRYHMDARNRSRLACTKHKDQSKVLTPGVLLFWCGQCRKCIFFQVGGCAALLCAGVYQVNCLAGLGCSGGVHALGVHSAGHDHSPCYACTRILQIVYGSLAAQSHSTAS